ncbi:MAG: hypothetical protein K6E81_03790 [Lachnospiraceae bacterium]|nr:hypothetical protein [Lachnospiraceae bacterium]
MEIFEEISGQIYSAGKAIAEKAGKLSGIAKLKSEISTCDEVLKKNYIEIGRKYYEAHREEEEDPYDKQLKAITHALAAKAKLEEDLKAAREVK